MALQDFLDASVEALNHSVCLGRLWRGQTVINVQGCAEFIELMLASRSAFAQAEEPICELLAIVRKYGSDAHRTGSLEIAQEAPSVGRRFCIENANEDPPCGPIDGHEEIAAAALISHLGQVFDVDVHVTGLISLECTVFGLGYLGLHVTQVAYAVATQATIQPRPRRIRIEKLPDHRQ